MKALRCPNCLSTNVTDYIKLQATCNDCKKIFTEKQEVRDLFHQLWGIATMSILYRKDIWNRLRELLGL